MTKKLPRVLLITRNLPPLCGGMERLNLHMARSLSEWTNLTVIGPQGCNRFLPNKTEVIEVPARPLWRFLLSTRRAVTRLSSHRFEFVLAGSGLTAPLARRASKKSKSRSIAYVHGLDLVASHFAYRLFWIPQLRRLDLALANSRNTANLAARRGVAGGRIRVIHPGVSLPKEFQETGSDFRARHQLDQGPLLLSVGRLTPRKGLADFIRHSLPDICSRHPDTKLLVIGNEAPDALSGSGHGNRAALEKLAAELGMSDALIMLGPCDDDTLKQAYFAADVHVFPVREIPGDVEGFGMVAIEAAAHGLPTVAFAVGGVPDAVEAGQSGYLVQPGNYQEFRSACASSSPMVANSPWKKNATKFAERFTWMRFAHQLKEAISQSCRVDNDKGKRQRRGHAVLSLTSRQAKAQKIQKLLDLEAGKKAISLLEVGSGSGGIAHYFGTHPALECRVEAVDLEDCRQISKGYHFTKVDSTTLPFNEATFDVVLSNHVIEHVGDSGEQRLHLQELRRVLKPEGIGYLAVPNRWQWIEPHYKLAGLSWLPEKFRSRYLRWRGRGDHYDCRPLSVAQLERILADAGFHFEQQHARALRLTYQLERPNALIWRVLLPTPS